MQIGRVIGDVVASRKDPALEGIPLLARAAAGRRRPAGGPAARGRRQRRRGRRRDVFFVRGKEASFPFHPAEPAADAGIVGILDHWTVGE